MADYTSFLGMLFGVVAFWCVVAVRLWRIDGVNYEAREAEIIQFKPKKPKAG